jgi:hypothetical protein
MKRFNISETRRRRLSLGGGRLEISRVLDASALPVWDQMPDMAGQALTVSAGFIATAPAQVGDFTYTTARRVR